MTVKVYCWGLAILLSVIPLKSSLMRSKLPKIKIL